MLYSHDGMGLGHVRRNVAIAAALTNVAPEASILLVSGSDEVHRLGVPQNVEILKLPGLRKESNERYVARTLHIAPQDILGLRANLLATTARTFRPHVLLVDKHPLGASGELRDTLAEIKRNGGLAVLGLRDILDDPVTVQTEWHRHGIPDRIAEHYERILVYGDHRVLDPVREYKLPSTLAHRTWFCGYVVNNQDRAVGPGDPLPALLEVPRQRPVVLATAGGGEDGFAMLAAFVRAARGAPWAGVAVTGPLASSSDQQALQSLAQDSGVVLYTSVSCLSRWFEAVDALVTMGGYNTMIEAISGGIPTVCIPRTRPRQEQLIRARAFDRLGLVQTLEPDHLTPTALRQKLALCLDQPRESVATRAKALFDFRGAQRAAFHLLELSEASIKQAQSDMVVS
jgi:predicted glycosyltransferase